MQRNHIALLEEGVLESLRERPQRQAGLTGAPELIVIVDEYIALNRRLLGGIDLDLESRRLRRRRPLPDGERRGTERPRTA